MNNKSILNLIIVIITKCFETKRKENTWREIKQSVTHNHSQSLVVHINHADREHPGSSLGMFRKHSGHTELKRQQQRSLAGYCSNPYVRHQANCDTQCSHEWTPPPQTCQQTDQRIPNSQQHLMETNGADAAAPQIITIIALLLSHQATQAGAAVQQARVHVCRAMRVALAWRSSHLQATFQLCFMWQHSEEIKQDLHLK